MRAGHEVAPVSSRPWPSGVPFVSVTDEISEPEALVDAVRVAIRGIKHTTH